MRWAWPSALGRRGAILRGGGGGGRSIRGHQRPQMNGLQPFDPRHDPRHADNSSNLLILCTGLMLRLYILNHNCYAMNGWRKLSSRCQQAQKQPKARFCLPKDSPMPTPKPSSGAYLAAFTAQPQPRQSWRTRKTNPKIKRKQMFLWTLFSLKQYTVPCQKHSRWSKPLTRPLENGFSRLL